MKYEVVMMNREVLVEYPNNPYKVRLDAEMVQLIESIEKYGVLVPLIVWKNEKGKYEIVSGHRRKWACVYLGIDNLPVIVKNWTEIWQQSCLWKATCREKKYCHLKKDLLTS